MRLIDADKLKKCFSPTLYGRKVYNAEEILMTIQTTPTIDAEPIKHGKWIYTGFMEVKCNNCGNVFHELEDRNYCPNCGAAMDETIYKK